MSRIDAALDGFRSLDALARRDTPLARLDARAKVFVTLAFLLVTVSFSPYSVAALLPLAAYPVAMAALGDVPAAALWRRLLVALPFPLLVGIFNPWFDRSPAMALGTVEISGGWLSFASILVRFVLTVSAAMILVATTGMHDLCVALRRLGLPQVFVNQLMFLHRYVVVLGGEAARMWVAHRLRAGGRNPSFATYGALVGHLLLRAFDRAQRVHLAIVARGFDGELRSLQRASWRARDTAFVLAWCAFFAVARGIDLPASLGALFAGSGS